jgi:cytochrome c oxidase assembly protein subunit 15
VVAHELAAWIVTVHMIVALVIVQLLVFVTADSIARIDLRSVWSRGWPALALIVLTLVQIGFGTQVRGAVDAALDSGVARDLALGTVGRLDYLHRDLAFVVLAGTAGLSIWLLSRRSAPQLIRWSLIVLLLALLQVALGVFMAYASLLPAAQVAHLTIASLLLGAETVLLLRFAD